MVALGNNPIYHWLAAVKPSYMRKTRNGQPVEVKQFLQDLRTLINEGQQLLRSGFTGVKDQTLEGWETVTEFANGSPYKAVGVGFALGVVAGLGAALLLSRGED